MKQFPSYSDWFLNSYGFDHGLDYGFNFRIDNYFKGKVECVRADFNTVSNINIEDINVSVKLLDPLDNGQQFR